LYQNKSAYHKGGSFQHVQKQLNAAFWEYYFFYYRL